MKEDLTIHLDSIMYRCRACVCIMRAKSIVRP